MFTRKNGNITVIVVGTLLVAGVGMYFLTNRLAQLQQTEKHSTEIIAYQMALSSTVNYVMHAIKERWCVTENLSQRDCFTSIDEWANDPLNTGRLLIGEVRLSDDDFLREYRNGSHDKDEQIKLGTASNPFNVSIDLSTISSRHPLFVSLNALRDREVFDAVNISVSRVNNIHYPSSQDDIYLSIQASLHSRLSVANLVKRFSGVSVLGQGKELFREAIVGFFPREADSFALVVANDMRLDSSSDLSGVGDFQIPKLENKTELASGSHGVVFTSPVFVNGNVVLADTANGNHRTEYNATTFASRLVLGDGSVMLSDNGRLIASTPASAGGIGHEFYSQLSQQFGGFRQGLVQEGTRDRGLDYLFKLKSGITPDRSLMAQCIERNLVQTDLNFTRESALVVRASGPVTAMSDGVFKYRLALTKKNVFMEQYGFGGLTLQNNNPDVVAADLKQDHKPIARMVVEFPTSGVRVTANVSRESFLTITADRGGDRALAAAAGKVSIQISPVLVEGNIQPNQVDLTVGFENASVLSEAPSISIQAYEVGSNGAGGLRESFMRSNHSVLTFAKGANSLVQPDPMFTNTVDFMTANPQGSEIVTTLLPEGDATLLERSCTAVVAGPSIDSDFAPYARSSWLFAPILASDLYQFNIADFDGANSTQRSEQIKVALTDLIGKVPTSNYVDEIVTAVAQRTAGTFGDVNISYQSPIVYLQRTKDLTKTLIMEGPDYQRAELTKIIAQQKRSKWPVYTMLSDSSNGSIAGECVIESSADFVTGFYVCDKLIIKPRKSPLRIVGSFVVGSTQIDPSAVKHGIVWSSIFDRQAVEELMAVGRLGNGEGCADVSVPAWQPANLAISAKRMACNPLSLRVADPFRWTTVDPDCALLDGKQATTCKRMIRRYTATVISSGGTI